MLSDLHSEELETFIFGKQCLIGSVRKELFNRAQICRLGRGTFTTKTGKAFLSGFCGNTVMLAAKYIHKANICGLVYLKFMMAPLSQTLACIRHISKRRKDTVFPL